MPLGGNNSWKIACLRRQKHCPEKTVITERWSGQRSSHGGEEQEGPSKDGRNVAVGVVKYSCLGKFPVGQAELSYGKGLTPRGSDIWPE